MSRPAANTDCGRLIAIGLLGFLLLVGLVVGWGLYDLWRDNAFWTTANIVETQRRGEQIIAAVDAHIEAHGKVPGSIDDLVDLKKLAPLTGNRAWSYRRRPGGGYVLSFSANHDDYPCAWFDSTIGEWRFDE